MHHLIIHINLVSAVSDVLTTRLQRPNALVLLLQLPPQLVHLLAKHREFVFRGCQHLRLDLELGGDVGCVEGVDAVGGFRGGGVGWWLLVVVLVVEMDVRG